MNGEVPALIAGTLQGLVATTLFVLSLFVGFAVLFGFPKLRRTGGGTLTVRSLDEAMGRSAIFLPPDAPRGPADQLQTPELQEASTRKSG